MESSKQTNIQTHQYEKGLKENSHRHLCYILFAVVCQGNIHVTSTPSPIDSIY